MMKYVRQSEEQDVRSFLSLSHYTAGINIDQAAINITLSDFCQTNKQLFSQFSIWKYLAQLAVALIIAKSFTPGCLYTFPAELSCVHCQAVVAGARNTALSCQPELSKLPATPVNWQIDCTSPCRKLRENRFSLKASNRWQNQTFVKSLYLGNLSKLEIF